MNIGSTVVETLAAVTRRTMGLSFCRVYSYFPPYDAAVSPRIAISDADVSTQPTGVPFPSPLRSVYGLSAS